MNRNNIYAGLGLWVLLLAGCKQPTDRSVSAYQAEPVKLQLEKRGDSYFATGYSAFSAEDHFTWGASVTKADNGKYYMIFSAPEAYQYPFGNAWVMGSKLGLAVSDRPDGGFKKLGFFYNQDGFAHDTSAWDVQTVSNPHVRKFGDTYYLYYAGSVDPGNLNVKSKTDTLDIRSRIQQSQQIGVITFKSFEGLLQGDFEHYDKPLLAPRTRVKPTDVVNPSPKGTIPQPDNLITVNPSVVYRPSDKNTCCISRVISMIRIGEVFMELHYLTRRQDLLFLWINLYLRFLHKMERNYRQKILMYGIIIVTGCFMRYSRTLQESLRNQILVWR